MQQMAQADPELLLGLPAKITAATGMDALTHLIEAFLAKGNNPLCDGIALEGIYLVSQHLRDCVKFAQTQFTEEIDQAVKMVCKSRDKSSFSGEDPEEENDFERLTKRWKQHAEWKAKHVVHHDANSDTSRHQRARWFSARLRGSD